MFFRLLFLLCCGTMLSAQSTAELTVTVTDLAPGGKLMIGLYDSEGTFLEDGKEYTGVALSVTSTSVSHTFSVPAGTYAATVYHDENSNGELDTGMFGIPKEPYGFSNNAFGRFGPPDFEAVKLILVAGTATTTNLQLR